MWGRRFLEPTPHVACKISNLSILGWKASQKVRTCCYVGSWCCVKSILRSYDARKYAKQYSQIFSKFLNQFDNLHNVAQIRNAIILEKISRSSLNRSFLPSFEGVFTGCHWSLRLFFQHFKPFQATFLLLPPVWFLDLLTPATNQLPIDDPASLGIQLGPPIDGLYSLVESIKNQTWKIMQVGNLFCSPSFAVKWWFLVTLILILVCLERFLLVLFYPETCWNYAIWVGLFSQWVVKNHP